MKESGYKYTEMLLLYEHAKTQNLYQSGPTVDGVNSQYARFSVETLGCLTALQLDIESKACSLVR